MNSIIKTIRPAFLSLLVFTVLGGGVYTLSITGLSQVIFPNEANGSLVEVTLEDGTQQVVGSEFIAQEFTSPEYMIGRPMWETNLSPDSAELSELRQERIEWLTAMDPQNEQDIPADLVSGSGSGVDPHISTAAASFQIERIAAERNIDQADVQEIIDRHTTSRFLGFWGEPGVNVLMVNLDLDGLLE